MATCITLLYIDYLVILARRNTMRQLIAMLCCLLLVGVSYADMAVTKRIPQFSNDKVTVWQATIYPTASQMLKMHRHEHDRVLVAFDSGTLKITNDKGKIHYLKLEKNKSYYLTKDFAGEMHNDENVSHHPITILVIELKN